VVLPINKMNVNSYNYIVLVTNTWLVENITGGIAVINSLRYIMIGIMGLYIIPVVIAIIYGQCRVIIDILFSTLSFIFYSPTYLNILNIYALCRMDDISWGTKGLNAESTGRNKEMT
jgi:cellulose synthase/poly-beta-1,6-N-acetylglucosamine synthase-like glycosyltransferase